MAALQETHPWVGEVIDLHRQGVGTSAIAEAVGKHPATIRKAIAKAREEGTLVEASEPIEGQTTVDDFTGDEDRDVWVNTATGEEVTVTGTPVEPDRDPLEDFRAEAGEAVGEMQTRPGEEPAGEIEPEPPLMPGTRQMVLDFGPNAAIVTKATITFKSEKWPSGHFGPGDLVRGTFTARIVSMPVKEKFDKDIGDFVSAPIDYGALITEIEYEAVDPGE